MRRWLSVSFALGGIFGSLAIGLFTLLQLQTAPTSAASSPVVAVSVTQKSATGNINDYSDSQEFFSKRGIVLSIAPTAKVPGASWTNYSDSSDKNVNQASRELQEEWLKYGAAQIEASGLKSIYLVKNLNVDGQARSGLPEPKLGDALYFDISSVYLQSENSQYMRRTFHHEFSHLIEYNLFGSYAPQLRAWSGCNAAIFKYGNGGASMYSKPDYAHKSHPEYGFIDGYATSAVEEDKAEVFAWYMMEPVLVQKLAAQDSGLACKLAQTQTLLQKL